MIFRYGYYAKLCGILVISAVRFQKANGTITPTGKRAAHLSHKALLIETSYKERDVPTPLRTLCLYGV